MLAFRQSNMKNILSEKNALKSPSCRLLPAVSGVWFVCVDAGSSLRLVDGLCVISAAYQMKFLFYLSVLFLILILYLFHKQSISCIPTFSEDTVIHISIKFLTPNKESDVTEFA